MTASGTGSRGDLDMDAEPERPRQDEAGHEHSFLLVPAGEAGKAYAEAARRALPFLHLVSVPGQADLMFCREQDSLPQEAVERVLRPCRLAYEEVAPVPTVSPHARFDIQDWTPLDP